MSLDTTAINRQLGHFGDSERIWLFGYGSLIYKADFPYLERRRAFIRDWSRRLWQGSHDHRGTPDAPGRVATLVAEPGARCAGMAYLITRAELEHLDIREKNGYLRFVTPLALDDGRCVEGLVYIATEENAAFLGAAEPSDIARHIAASSGPSGPNRDYLLQLASALREMEVGDAHVFAIEAELAVLLRDAEG